MPESDAQFPELDEAMVVEPAKPGKLPTMLSLLALLVSALALAGVAWLALQAPPAPQTIERDDSRIDSLASAVDSGEAAMRQLRQNLADLGDRDAALRRQLESLDREYQRQLQDIDSLPARMSNVEDTMSSIQGISVGVRNNWLLAEAEYYMQIANAQLQLAGNPELARLALLQADERIQQLADPALTSVRRTLAGELNALQNVVHPDIEGITLTLSSLANNVEQLPLRRDVDAAEPAAAAAPEELAGLDRAVASLKSTMNDVISVRRVDEDVRPLIAPEAAYFLRTNLALQLQAARLALLRNEQAVFQQSLDDAANWLTEFYDTDSSRVTAAQETLAEIRTGLFDVDTPDISQSLKQLRRYNQLTSSPQNRDLPATEPELPVQDPPAESQPTESDPQTDDETTETL